MAIVDRHGLPLSVALDAGEALDHRHIAERIRGAFREAAVVTFDRLRQGVRAA